MDGAMNSFGIHQITDINQDPFGFPPHLRPDKTTNTRIAPPIPSLYPSAENYITKKSTADEVRGHFPLDGIAGEMEQDHGLPLSTSAASMSDFSSSSFNCPSYQNSSQPYTSLNCGNSLTAEPPSVSDGYYHSREPHVGSSYPFADYSMKNTSTSLRIHHPSSMSTLPAQKPTNYSSLRTMFNLNPVFPDTGPYNYYPQTNEPKVPQHPHFYTRPFPAPMGSAFADSLVPESVQYASESPRYVKDDSRNFGLANRGERLKPQNQGESREVEDVDDANRCKNTVEGTKTSVRRFKKWYKDKTGKSLDMNIINKNMAVELLKDFFLEIRDTRPGKEGNEYEPVTLTTYRNGLRRYFLERKCPPAVENFDLADREFDVVNYGLVTKRNELKRKGKGNHPNVVESITEAQLERMWASGAIGVHAPRPLLRLQWWINTVCHGIRGRMAHHDLSIDDFRISRGPDGKIVIDHVKAGSKRSRAGGADDKESTRNKKRCKAKVAATDGGDRDPVRAFEVYLRHRPPGISSFYLTPKHKPKGDIWFNKVPMGKNSIGRIMREIKAIAGIG